MVFLCSGRYAEAEKTNGRWAMAAVAGILFTDAMGLPRWFDEAQQATYWCVHIHFVLTFIHSYFYCL